MAVFCALFGHARVYTTCFGYVSCARCRQQLGDTLAGSFSDAGGVSCDCTECQRAWANLKWVERAFCKRPRWTGLTPAQTRAENSRKLVEATEAIQRETLRLRAEREARS